MKSNNILTIEKLTVSIDNKQILNDVNLSIKQGETHVLLGPNGTGKSTLAAVIVGNQNLKIDNGRILYQEEDITNMSVNDRAKKGIFLSFQNPIEIPGITVSSFIRNAIEIQTNKKLKLFEFKKELLKTMDFLHIDESYAERDLNVGFSGGEKKKAEILQLLMLKPKLAILDETDSGLDVDAVKIVSKGINEYQKNCNGSLLIITHSTKILESLNVDFTHIMIDGSIKKTSDASLITEINKNGFKDFIKE